MSKDKRNKTAFHVADDGTAAAPLPSHDYSVESCRVDIEALQAHTRQLSVLFADATSTRSRHDANLRMKEAKKLAKIIQEKLREQTTRASYTNQRDKEVLQHLTDGFVASLQELESIAEAELIRENFRVRQHQQKVAQHVQQKKVNQSDSSSFQKTKERGPIAKRGKRENKANALSQLKESLLHGEENAPSAGLTNSSQAQQQKQPGDVFEEEMLKEKQESIRRLEQDLAGIHDLYQELKSVVAEQHPHIESIGVSMTSAETATAAAAEQIQQARIAQRRKAKRKCIFIGVLSVIFTLCLLIFDKWTTGLISSSTKHK